MKKIFVSSTFRDMNAERDIIHRMVMPRLNKIAGEYGESITFCDLRWGVDTSDMESDEGARKVLDVCLNEIDKCKPYLIVLLGQRYGWVPDERLISDAIKRKNLILPNKEKNISVTELEIRYGAFNNLDHTLFYFRNIEGEIPEKYRDDYLSDENADKLKSLKKDIENLSKKNKAFTKHKYVLSWDNEKNSLSVGLDEFANQIIQDVHDLMRTEWEERKTWSDYKRDRHLQWDFAEQKSIQYIDHDNLISDCIEAVNTSKIIAIKGASGSGKSTLMSRMAITLKKQGWHVLSIFSGLTTKTTTTVGIIRYIIRYIEDELSVSFFRKESPKIEDWVDTIELALNKWNEEKNKGRLIILIDAIDQLHDDSHRKELRFIPPNLSNKVKMAFSCLNEFEIVQDMISIDMPTIDGDSKKDIINGILQLSGKQLSKNVVEAICRKPASDNPLYMSLVIQRLNMMNQNDYEEIASRGDEIISTNGKNHQMLSIEVQQMEILNSCPDDVESFCHYLIDAATDMLDVNFVKSAVEYIAVSRYGLREHDLENILSHDGIKWDALQFSLFINYLSNFFMQREDGRYDFTHKNIRSGCRKIVTDEISLHRNILICMQNLNFDDVIRQKEIVFHCMMADDKHAFVKYISEMESKNIERKDDIRAFAADAMNFLSQKDYGKWIHCLLNQITINNLTKGKANVSFFSKLFTDVIKKLKQNKTDEIIYPFNDVLCLLNFFSKLDYSYWNTIKETDLILSILHDSIHLSERINAQRAYREVQKLRADIYLCIGDIYINSKSFDNTYANIAREKYKESRDIYISMVEESNDIEEKKQLTKLYGKIAITYILDQATSMCEWESSSQNALKLAEDIVMKEKSKDNVCLFADCIAIRYFSTTHYYKVMKNVFRNNHSISQDDIKKIEDVFSLLDEFDNNRSNDFHINESRFKLCKILSTMYNFLHSEKAVLYAKTGLDILKKSKLCFSSNDFSHQIEIIYGLLATAYQNSGSMDNAAYYCKKQISTNELILQKSNLDAERLGALTSISFAYFQLGEILFKNNFNDGIRCMEEAVKFFPNASNHIYIPFLYDRASDLCDDEIMNLESRLKNTTDSTQIETLKSAIQTVMETKENFLILMSEHPKCSEYLKWASDDQHTYKDLIFK